MTPWIRIACLAALAAATCAAPAAAGSECAADLDQDFDVDSNDLNVLLAGLGCDAGPGETCPGDLNADGATDSADLNILLSEFATACGLGCGAFIAGDCCSANDTPFCDAANCCTGVCTIEPLCCEAVWDGACADLASLFCEPCIPESACCLSRGGCLIMNEDECIELRGVFHPGGVTCAEAACDPTPECGEPAAGPCCAVSQTPYCQDADCCDAVCAVDPACCTLEWDQACVDLALDACGACLDTNRWHVDYQQGDDANDGLSWATPFATNARLIESLADGDVAYFRGQFRPDDVHVFTGYTGVALIGDPGFDFDGAGRPWIGRQAVRLDAGAWREIGGGRFVQPIPPELPVLGVVQDWDDTTLAGDGFPNTHAGHLPPASGPALDDGHWHYESASGELIVRPWGGGPAGAREIEYLLDGHGINLVNCDDCTLRNFTAKLCVRFGSGNGGYGIRTQSSINCTIEDCDVFDAGDHSVGMAGFVSANNVIRNVRAFGQDHDIDPAGGFRPSIMYVFAGSTTDGGGNRAIDCFGSPSPLLRPDGVPLKSIDKWRGSFGLSHGGFGGDQDDVEWRRAVYDASILQFLKTDGWDIGDNRQGFVSGTDWSQPLDPADPSTYPVRTYDCVVKNAFLFGGATAVAHTRLRASIDGADFVTGFAGLTFLNVDAALFFDYCILTGTVESGDSTDGNGLFFYQSDVDIDIRTRNSLFAIHTDETFTTDLQRRDGVIFSGGGPARLDADRCLFVRTGGADPTAAPYFILQNDNPIHGAQLFFSDCWYAALQPGAGAGFFHEAAFAPGVVAPGPISAESLDDWITLGDPAGVYNLDPLLIGGWPVPNLDPALTEPSPASPVRAPAFKLPPRPGGVGVNGLPDDGTIGPWQYGEPAP